MHTSYIKTWPSRCASFNPSCMCNTHSHQKTHQQHISFQQPGVQHSHQKTHQHTHLFNNYNRLYNMAFNSRGMSTLATTSPLWASSWDPQLPTWALFYSTLCSLVYYFLLQLTLMSSLFYYVLLYSALLWSLFYYVILYFLSLTLSVSSCTMCLLCHSGTLTQFASLGSAVRSTCHHGNLCVCCVLPEMQ